MAALISSPDDKGTKMGDYHSWWLPDSPKDAEFWHFSRRRKRYEHSTNHSPDADGVYRTGGPWISYESTLTFDGPKVQTYRLNEGIAYNGSYVVNNTGIIPLDLYDSGRDDFVDSVFNKGAEAINLMRPDAPDFSAAVSLAELREVPGMLKGLTQALVRKIRRAQKYRALRQPNRKRYWYSYAGEWYLAIEFGWKPLLSDIQKFSETFNNKHKRLDQLIKDEGKPVRRRRKMSNYDSDDSDVFVQDEPTKVANPYMKPTHVTQCYAKGWGLREEQTLTERTWCSGQARYILPKGPRTAGWKRKMYRKIMGGEVTPSAAYNLIPWSWLVDYFSDLGEFVDAVSPGVADRLIWDYAYIMRTREITRDLTGYQNVFTSKSKSSKVTAQQKLVTKIKTRVGASRFGFGVKESDLTLKQSAILGALGLSLYGG